MASVKTPLFGGDNSALDALATSYNRVNATYPSSWTGTETYRAAVISQSLDLSQFYMKLDTAPGVGNGFTFTVLKNGVATSLSVSISGNAMNATNATAVVSFVAGDTVSIQCQPVGTPTAAANQWWNFLVTTSDGAAPILSGFAGPSTSATVYGVLTAGGSGATAWSATEAASQIIVPTSGTLSNLYAFTTSAPGSTKSYQFTLIKNGAATLLSTTVTGAATTAHDSTNSVSVVAGDSLTISSTPTNTPVSSVSMSFGLKFTPTTAGETFFGFGSANLPSATATNYEQVLGIGNNAWTPTESNRYLVPGPCTIAGMYVKIGTAPGTGNTRTFALRKTGVTTSLAATVSDTGTTANASANISYVQDDIITIQSAVGGTPAADTGGVHAGFLVKGVVVPSFTPWVTIY